MWPNHKCGYIAMFEMRKPVVGPTSVSQTWQSCFMTSVKTSGPASIITEK